MPAIALNSATTSGSRRGSGENSPSSSMSRAAFTRALSAIPGIEAWPLRPCTRRRNAQLDTVARAFVQRVLGPNRFRMLLAEPGEADVDADLLVGCRHEDQVARRL